MIMKNLLLLSLLATFLGPSPQAHGIDFKKRDFALAISESGQIAAMRDPRTGKNFLAPGQKAALLRVRVGHEWLEPVKASFALVR